MSGPARVKVLYFAGSGRSGTTIINNIVGQLDGAFAAGELRFLWDRGVVENRLCGCGLPFHECPTWQAVMSTAFPGDPGDPGGAAPDPHAIAGRLISRLRLRQLPAMMARKVVGRRAAPPHPDDEALTRMYAATAECTGAQVILDSSKLPGYGLLLADLPGIDLYVLTLGAPSGAVFCRPPKGARRGAGKRLAGWGGGWRGFGWERTRHGGGGGQGRPVYLGALRRVWGPGRKGDRPGAPALQGAPGPAAFR